MGQLAEYAAAEQQHNIPQTLHRNAQVSAHDPFDITLSCTVIALPLLPRCHVMEHESFESEETAAVMNKHFINIKVDREERPDVDRVYVSAAVELIWARIVLCTLHTRPAACQQPSGSSAIVRAQLSPSHASLSTSFALQEAAALTAVTAA